MNPGIFNRRSAPAAAISAIMLGALAGPAGAATFDLTATVRDFSDAHPDMEGVIGGVETGLVQSALGADGDPVAAGTSSQFTGDFAPGFRDWYGNDNNNFVFGSTPITITLDNAITADPNVFTFSDSSFFPIDNQLGGNQGRNHNFHFTLEINSEFTYQGGETFTFTGDDDLWLFIDGQLIVDLGGVHQAVTESVDLDTLGLAVGETYSFDLFFAERHTSQSTFRIDTSILLQDRPDIPEPGTLALAVTGLLGAGFLGRRCRRKA